MSLGTKPCCVLFMSFVVDVRNGLRKGYCMGLVLFSLFTCLVMERWQARLEGAQRVGITMNHTNDTVAVQEILACRR